MIYHFQKRLIRICGVSVFFVFLLIFLAICSVSIHRMNGGMDSLADSIARDGGLPVPGRGTESGERPKGMPREPFGEEAHLNIRFFLVQMDEKGEIISIDTAEDRFIGQEEAEAYSQKAYERGKERGWTGGYRYKVSESDTGIQIVFVEGSMNVSVSRMLLISVGAVLVAAAAVILLLVIIFSRRAVRPIAETYEKQKQFITDANHELKTPLTLIMTNLDIVENETGKNEWIDDIRSEGERMTALVNQLITLTRMDESSARVYPVKFCLSDVIQETAEEYRTPAEERGLRLYVETDRAVSCSGDEEDLRRLLGILLENAVKYCDSAGEIRVILSRRRHPHIRLENTYRNVNDLELDRLFDRFYRSDKARTFTGGFGIGLSIARAIAENHKGEITAYKKDDCHIGFKVILR